MLLVKKLMGTIITESIVTDLENALQNSQIDQHTVSQTITKATDMSKHRYASDFEMVHS